MPYLFFLMSLFFVCKRIEQMRLEFLFVVKDINSVSKPAFNLFRVVEKEAWNYSSGTSLSHTHTHTQNKPKAFSKIISFYHISIYEISWVVAHFWFLGLISFLRFSSVFIQCFKSCFANRHDDIITLYLEAWVQQENLKRQREHM